ncbi:MAG: WYL domain-containing protein [Planctomycetaceae bacterium]|nr:WYL domain-containing protein [Planctomycetaceae bacterium]
MPQKLPPTARQWKLIAALKDSEEGCTLKELVKRLGVTERTIQRDLLKLIESGLPLQEYTEAHGRKLWSIQEDPFEPAMFNFEEAAALYLGHRFLTPLTNSFLWEASEKGLQKIRRQLGTRYVSILDQLLDIFHESTTGWSDYSQQSDIITTLITACEDERETAIRYRSYTAEEEQEYTIHPYALIMQSGTFYLVGFHCKRKEIRTWKLNRIVTAECLPTKFKKPKDFDLEKQRRINFGFFVSTDKAVERIRIKVTGWMARYVREHHWHMSQQFAEQPDGSVTIQFEVMPNFELTRWILSFGCNAEVLEPESLRQEIEKEIAEMQRQYKKSETKS